MRTNAPYDHDEDLYCSFERTLTTVFFPVLTAIRNFRLAVTGKFEPPLKEYDVGIGTLEIWKYFGNFFTEKCQETS